MAEASITLQIKSSCTKKRQNKNGQLSKNKKLLTNYASTSIDMTSTLSQKSSEEMDLNLHLKQTFKTIYHLGGRKYVVYYDPKGLIGEIYIKEWDGEVTLEGIKLNLSRFVMILHNIEIIDHTLDKILKGELDLDVKIHIGGHSIYQQIIHTKQ